MLCCAVLCCAVLCCAVLCCAVLSIELRIFENPVSAEFWKNLSRFFCRIVNKCVYFILIIVFLQEKY